MLKGSHYSAEERLAIRLRRLKQSMPPEEFAQFMAADGTLKWCYRCRQLKPVGEFYKSRHTFDGLAGGCKSCSDALRSANNRKLREDPEYVEQQRKISREWWAAAMELCTQAYYAADSRDRQDHRTRWVMNLARYKQLRAVCCTEDQERARAAAHAVVWVSATDRPPHKCPACGAGPFAAMDELTGHVATMADPANREPAAGDLLFGIPVEVRDNGGEPHLETPPRFEWTTEGR